MTRLGYVIVTCLAAMGAVAATVVPTPTKLIWNVTASAPVGLYTVEPADAIEVPELVAVLPPEPLAQFMVARGYVGHGVPLLKRVLGVPGQRVCRIGRTITCVEIVGTIDQELETLEELCSCLRREASFET